MPDYGDHHRAVERDIRELLSRNETRFSPDELGEVREFLDAREYGLALETFAAMVLEHGDAFDSHEVAEIERLAGAMELLNDGSINNLLDAYRRQNYRAVM